MELMLSSICILNDCVFLSFINKKEMILLGWASIIHGNSLDLEVQFSLLKTFDCNGRGVLIIKASQVKSYCCCCLGI